MSTQLCHHAHTLLVTIHQVQHQGLQLGPVQWDGHLLQHVDHVLLGYPPDYIRVVD